MYLYLRIAVREQKLNNNSSHDSCTTFSPLKPNVSVVITKHVNIFAFRRLLIQCMSHIQLLFCSLGARHSANKNMFKKILLTFPISYENVIFECSQNVQNVSLKMF